MGIKTKEINMEDSPNKNLVSRVKRIGGQVAGIERTETMISLEESLDRSLALA